jgi:hypothetical protein
VIDRRSGLFLDKSLFTLRDRADVAAPAKEFGAVGGGGMNGFDRRESGLCKGISGTEHYQLLARNN